jgi:oxygen-dependent protoporphyrinogen oxidase
MSVRVVVIGAGAAGLSAAWRLRAGGADGVVFEAAAEVGGLLSTEEVDGASVDTAVQLLSSTYTRLFALASESGCRELLVRASGRDALWRRGRAEEITYGSISGMITTGALPTMLKLRLGAKYVPFLTMQAARLDANDPAATGGAVWDSESISAWGRREIGADFVEYLAYPLLAAYYGSPPEATSAAIYHALARVGMDVQVYSVRGGMRALATGVTDALRTRGVEIRCGSAVQALRQTGAGWDVELQSGTERADAVILATPPAAAAALLRGADAPALSAWLDGAATRPAATLSLVLEGTLRAEWFGLSFPRVEPPGDRIVAVAAQQNKPAGLVPDGSSVLTIFPAPEMVEQVTRMNESEATDLLGPAVEAVFPGALRRVRAAHVAAWADGYRVIAPGFIRRITELRTLSLPSGLALAGDYTMSPTVEGAVRSGELAAAEVSMPWLQ